MPLTLTQVNKLVRGPCVKLVVVDDRLPPYQVVKSPNRYYCLDNAFRTYKLDLDMCRLQGALIELADRVHSE
jgi:hypothetical protein